MRLRRRGRRASGTSRQRPPAAPWSGEKSWWWTWCIPNWSGTSVSTRRRRLARLHSPNTRSTFVSVGVGMIGVMSELVMPGPAPAGEPDLFAQVDAWLGCLQEAHRVEARVAAVKARFAAELARSTAVFEHADRNGVVNAVTAEIAMALGVTRM